MATDYGSLLPSAGGGGSALQGILGSVIPGIGAVSGLISGISGLLGGKSKEQRAMEAYQAAANDWARANNQTAIARNQRDDTNVAAAAGQGGDMVRQVGSNVGGALANAGVYNSSTAAGAIDQAARTSGAQVSNLASTNRYNELQADNSANQHIADMRMGIGLNAYNAARQDRQFAGNNLNSAIGTIAQTYSQPVQEQGRSTGGAVNGQNNGQLGDVPVPGPVPLGGGVGSPSPTYGSGFGAGSFQPKKSPWAVGTPSYAGGY